MNKVEIRTRDRDNPYFSADHPESKSNPKTVQVAVNIRESSIAQMHARGQIDDPQFISADRFRGIYERAGQSGTRALDWTREVVDGGKVTDGLPAARMDALTDLNSIAGDLGVLMYPLVCKVAGDGITIGYAAELYAGRPPSQLERKYVGQLFRDALDILADRWGYRKRQA